MLENHTSGSLSFDPSTSSPRFNSCFYLVSGNFFYELEWKDLLFWVTLFNPCFYFLRNSNVRHFDSVPKRKTFVIYGLVTEYRILSWTLRVFFFAVWGIPGICSWRNSIASEIKGKDREILSFFWCWFVELSCRWRWCLSWEEPWFFEVCWRMCGGLVYHLIFFMNFLKFVSK